MIKKNILYILLLTCGFGIDYYNEIQPIFNQNCVDCHVGNSPSGGLNLTDYDNLMNGGNSGQVVIPGDHLNSILFERIDSGDMPSGGDRLNQEDIDLIASWINGGAGRCDEGYSYYPNAASEYSNITVQDGGTCFNNGDLEALADMISENDFEESMNAFELGTQTWNDGRLRFLVAGYYFGGVDTPIHTIPESINQLNDLRKLYLEWNNIVTLPDTFSELTALVQLYISNNQLETLPDNFGNMANLFILDLGYNQINSLPNSFINLASLGYLWLFNNQLSELPENFCDLDLDWNGDDYFGYPYFAIGGNMLCEDVPECVANSDHLNTSLEQYYYSVQITVEQDCDSLNLTDINENIIFEIDCIYPNPFNPITNIKFNLNASEKISISIFDLKGKLIEKIIDHKLLTSGYHNFSWNASSKSSGIYIVQISNGTINSTQKIILTK